MTRYEYIASQGLTLALGAAIFLAVTASGCRQASESSSATTEPAQPVDKAAVGKSTDAALSKTGEKATAGAANQPIFVVGQPAPEFVLPTLGDGKPMSLAQLRGKKTLLLVFASW